MKKLLVIVLLAVFSTTAFAHDPTFEKVYDKYKSYDGVVNFTVPGFIVRMALWFDDFEPEVEDFIRHIDKVKLIVVENDHLNARINFCREYSNALVETEMVEWLEVREDGEEVNIMARKDRRDNIREMVILVSGEENVMIYMKGRFTQEMFANMADDSEMHEMFH
ncbi:MAG: DUF4252 domain-containing protein [Bacteroidales bacterium]|nr:DUF4252 domain-containing protein [Bacteroidales bacterium]